MAAQLRLTLLVGPTVALPAPALLIDALDKVEVTQTDEGRSGFQITFTAGRGGMLGLMDYPVVMLPSLRAFSRVIVILTFNGVPSVLMDGIITDQQLVPSNEPGESTFTITGEDVSVMMDLEEKSVEHPGQTETVIALKLIGAYARYGLIPVVIPPAAHATAHRAYAGPARHRSGYRRSWRSATLRLLRHCPAPFTNTAYWGPPKRVGVPQRALSINMGAESNVEGLTFRNSALQPTLVGGQVRDRSTNQTIPVRTVASTRTPLAAQPALVSNQPNVRHTELRLSGLTTVQAFARAASPTRRPIPSRPRDTWMACATAGCWCAGVRSVRGADRTMASTASSVSTTA
jgi:hypothetical protein